jgi:arylformamidase
MICEFTWCGKVRRADLSRPIDLSMTLRANGAPNPSAWYVSSPTMTPVQGDGFVGEVRQGGSVNFRNIMFNPHGHGTHTECLGHITKELYSVDDVLRDGPTHFPCFVLSVAPEKRGEDFVVDVSALAGLGDGPWAPALVVRTLPNNDDKRTRAWSNTNPPYFTREFMEALVQHGVEHVLVDLPSVDREVDGGRLEGHHAFWGLPERPRKHCTITEFVFVPNNAPDGLYLLHLGVAPMANDASPSRPVLFPTA